MVPVTTTRREGRGGGGWKVWYIAFEMRPRTRNPAGKRRRRLLISANIFATRRRTSTFRNRNRHQILPKIKRTNIPKKPKLVSPSYLCTKAAKSDIKKATSTQSWYSCKKAWATSSNCVSAAISTRGNQSREEDEEKAPPEIGRVSPEVGREEKWWEEVLVGSTRSPQLKSKWAVILSSSPPWFFSMIKPN